MSRSTMAVLFLALVSLAAASSAGADELSIVTVNAPAVNCVYNTLCRVTVADSIGDIALPGVAGTARLQSRTFPGAPGTAGAGKTAYLYRVDLLGASGAVECLAGLVINFGPVIPMSYRAGSLADVFVITTGGIGTVGLRSAQRDGDVISFEFDKLLCVGSSPGHGVSTFFFGLTAATGPDPVTGAVFGIGSPPIIDVRARAPMH